MGVILTTEPSPGIILQVVIDRTCTSPGGSTGWIQKFDDTEYPAAVLIPSDQGKMIPEEEKPVKRVSDCGIWGC